VSRYKLLLSTIIQNYLVRGRMKPCIDRRLQTYLNDVPEVRELLRLRCPWCGRTFKSHKALAVHLRSKGVERKYSCPELFMMLVNSLTEEFYKISLMIRKDPQGYYKVYGLQERFNSFEEAYEVVKEVIK